MERRTVGRQQKNQHQKKREKVVRKGSLFQVNGVWMAKYDKKAALKIMIEAVKQYEEKLNDKQFLIIYRERKDIKTVNVGFRDMNFLHMTGVKTRLSAQQFYAACLESKLSEYDFEIDNKGKVQQKLMVLPYLAKNQSMHELRVSDEIFEMILVDEE